MGNDEDDFKKVLKDKKRDDEDDGVMYGDVDTGGYFVKSAWMQDGVETKSRYDQTEKSVDQYLQAVLKKY